MTLTISYFAWVRERMGVAGEVIDPPADVTTIADLVADDAIPSEAVRHDLHGATLLPGFIDAQVNGGGGALFNNDTSVEAIRTIAQAHRRFGTTGLLPTLISDDAEVLTSGRFVGRTPGGYAGYLRDQDRMLRREAALGAPRREAS